MVVSSTPSPPLCLAELMASLSMATDLGMGHPIKFAMTTCIVTVRLGKAAGLDEAELQDAYYEALLRYIGCDQAIAQGLAQTWPITDQERNMQSYAAGQVQGFPG